MKESIKKNNELVNEISKKLKLDFSKYNKRRNTMNDSTVKTKNSLEKEITTEYGENSDRMVKEVIEDILTFVKVNEIKNVTQINYRIDFVSIADNCVIDCS